MAKKTVNPAKTNSASGTIPPGWRRLRGRKDTLRQPFENGQVIWDTHLQLWFLDLPRGARPEQGGDWWGPWDVAETPEAEIRAEMSALHRRLRRGGGGSGCSTRSRRDSIGSRPRRSSAACRAA